MRTFHTFVLLSLLTAATFAQGPDVIVGSLNGVSSYGSSGGIYAYSVGTTSCNIGNVWLNWIDNTNQHPVIGQAIYRLKSGRFEQIGFSWLKHGFFALSGSLCFTDCQGTDGTHLGVHCSDPYDSGLNGDAFGLGPRNEVNASTGYFPYPVAGTYPNPAATIGRRIQCPAADVNPALNAGALYWAEGQYVTPDDAAAGNKNNNASYRTITFAAGSFAASLSGSTVQQQPAIAAWQASDPAVVLTNVDFPNDGRFIIGRKVTALGGGNFHYEFVVHNLTSDASGRGFTVDFPAGTVISNAGYRSAPAYHSGEPYVNTAWVNTINGNSVNWAGQTYIQNQNANAIRFGTCHNFWCDATAAAETNKTIELFKPYCPLADPVVPTGVSYAMNTAAPLDNPTLTAPVNGPSGDDNHALVNIGFTFNFYGTNYTQVNVDTNGYLTFPNSGTEEYQNTCMPNAGAPNAMIAAYWDDLVVGAGECQYQTLGSAPTRRFVVSWTNVNIFNTSLNQTFKVILDETTNKVTTTIVASAAGASSGGASATRGIENQFGNVALQASCNLAGSAVANTSQTFTPTPNILPSADLILSGSTGPFGVLGWTINSNAIGAPILMIVSSDPGPIDLGPTVGILNVGLPPGGFFILGDGAGILQPPNPLDFTDGCGDWSIFIPLGAGGLPPGFTLYNQAIVITSTSVPPPPNGGFHITDMEILTT